MELLKQQTSRFVRSAIQGHSGSFEQLVILYQDRVFSLALRLTGSTQDAEDLAQEVFIRAYRAIGTFRGEADFGTWLHRIAVNTWLNQKRKTQPKQAYSLDDPIMSDEGEVKREIADISNDPENVFLSSQMSSRLHTAVESLPKEQKAALLLREVEDYTYEEIALIMNSTVGTVRSRLSRARDALRRAYNGFDESYYDMQKKERRAADELHKGKKTDIGQNGLSAAPKIGKTI
jgi:RNA polymerase sigma-70 factor (ECF subfamily)